MNLTAKTGDELLSSTAFRILFQQASAQVWTKEPGYRRCVCPSTNGLRDNAEGQVRRQVIDLGLSLHQSVVSLTDILGYAAHNARTHTVRIGIQPDDAPESYHFESLSFVSCGGGRVAVSST